MATIMVTYTIAVKDRPTKHRQYYSHIYVPVTDNGPTTIHGGQQIAAEIVC